MDIAKDRDLLETLADFLGKNGCEGSVTDYDGMPVLVMEYTRVEEPKPEYFTMTIEHLNDSTSQISIVNTLFSGLDEETVACITPLISHMNRYLNFGGFGIDRINGYVYFSSGLDFTGFTGDLSLCFTVSFEQSRRTSIEGAKVLLPYISGSRSFTDIAPGDLDIYQ